MSGVRIRLFLTCWLVYVLHFATDFSREHYLVVSIVEDGSYALDKYYGDLGKYPASLNDLVEQKYLRSVPLDPVTDSAATWQVVAPADLESGGVYNVKSGAQGVTTTGAAYGDW